MKRAIAIILVMGMLFTLCACGHEHTWTEATCTEPKTCSSCGETEGEALGHTWTEATCTEPKTCTVCGETEGEALGHTWIKATCTEPKTCSVCGATEGEALGHTWAEATCTEPKTCTVCGVTEGEALGHTISEWVTETEATCAETGVEKGTCSVCGEEIEREIDKLPHTPGDWEVVVAATKDKDGTHVKRCTVCGEEVERESFTLTPEEIEKEYKAQCQYISYTDLQRNPGENKGKYITVSGTVFQIISEASSSLYYSTYFIRSSGNLYYILVDTYGSGTRILENDYITIWGEVSDLYTYETVRGNSNTVPKIYVEYYK